METKQVIVMRRDLNMRKGKIAAQAAHASLKVFLKLGTIYNNEMIIPMVNEAMSDWINGVFKKICVYVNSEQELLDIYNKAEERGLICSMIIDNGLTEFHNVPTKTCIAIGPDYSDIIDEITGDLTLY